VYFVGGVISIVFSCLALAVSDRLTAEAEEEEFDEASSGLTLDLAFRGNPVFWIGLIGAGASLFKLIAAVGLWSRRPFPGAIFLGAAGAYALARVVLQPAREAQDRLGPVNLQRTFAAALGILALLGLIVTWLGSSRNT